MTQLNDKKVRFYANSKTVGGYVAEEVSAMASELQERRSAAEAQKPVSTPELHKVIYHFRDLNEGFPVERFKADYVISWMLANYPPAQPVAVPDDLIMQIRRLVHALKNCNPDHSLVKLVPDYMKRMGYWHVGDCLRDAEAPQPVAVPDEITREEYKRRFMEEADFDNTFRGGWNACRAAMLNAEPVSQPYTLPEGWKLVPVEPTAEMISSGIAAHYERSQIQIHDRPAPGPMECAYVAMLAAAPAIPEFTTQAVDADNTSTQFESLSAQGKPRCVCIECGAAVPNPEKPHRCAPQEPTK